MTLDDLRVKVANKEFESKLPYAEHKDKSEEANKLRRAWKEDSYQLERRFCDELSHIFQTEGGATERAANVAVNFCWEEGHAFGYSEVLTYADQILDIFEAQKDAVANIRNILQNLSMAERLEVFSAVTEGYCKECGSDVLPCYCMRDE